MGNRGAKVFGLDKPFHKVEDNTPLMVNLVSTPSQTFETLGADIA
jgi:hypothetical protein